MVKSETDLKQAWEKYDFEKAKQRLYKKQRLLAIAVLQHQEEKIKQLSLEIVNSKEAKILAVKKVSGELDCVPGIDGIRWIKSSDKMKSALELNPKNYKAKQKKYL